MRFLRLLLAGLVAAIVVVGGLIAAAGLLVVALLVRLFGGQVKASATVRPDGPVRRPAGSARAPGGDFIDVETTKVPVDQGRLG